MRKIMNAMNRLQLMLYITTFLLGIHTQSFAQATIGKKYSFTCTEASLPTALKQVERISGYKMLFTYEDIQNYKTTVTAKDQTIDQLMSLILKDKPLTYKINGEFITVKRVVAPSKNIEKRQLTGKVLDENNQPLPGASVRIANTNIGSITDADGDFSLQILPEHTTLEVSFIGMQTQKISLKKNNKITVILHEDSYQLDDLIVTGYQTLSKERATGAFEIIDKKNLDSKINTDALSAIEGQLTGVSTYKDDIVIRGVSTFSSSIGTTPLLVIDGIPTERDLSSVNMNDVESIVVLKDAAASSIYGVRAANGVISIVTTKGKEGRTDIRFTADWTWKTNPSLDQYHYATTGDMMDFELAYNQFLAKKRNYTEAAYLKDRLKGIGEAGTNSTNIMYYSPLKYARMQYTNGEISEQEYNTLLDGWRNNDYRREFMKQVWQTPLRQSYNLSINSGSNRQSTYASVNYISNETNIKYDSYQYLKGYLKSTQKINKRISLDLGIDVQYTYTDTADDTYTSLTGMEPYTQILDGNNNRVYRDYVDIDNNRFTGLLSINPKVLSQIEGLPQFMSYRFNILDELEDNHTKQSNYNLRSYAKLNVKLLEGLQFTSSFSYELYKNHSETYNSEDSYYVRFLRNRFATYATTNSVIPEGGRLAIGETSGNNWVSRNQLDYSHIFKEDHAVSMVAGIELRQTRTNIPNYSVRYGYDPVSLSYTLLDDKTIKEKGYKQSYIYNNNTGPDASIDGNYIKLTDSFLNPTLSSLENRYVGFYAVGGYIYKDRYGISGSFRIDQANLFGTDPKYRYRPMWSVGLKWNVAKEDFLKTQPWINVLDLRASYGITGNVDQTTTPYLVAAMSSQNKYTSETIPYTSITTAPNPLLRWERTTSYNLGVDFILWGGMLNGKFDYYYKRSDDLLTTIDIPFTAGYTSQRVNYAAMTNHGFETTLSSTWLQTRDWVLSSTFLFSYNRNKVTKVFYESPQASGLVSGNYYQTGKPVDAVYAYRYGGLTSGGTDDQNGIPIISRADGTTMHHFNEDGSLVIDGNTSMLPEDVVYMGSGTPLFNSSFTQNLKFHEWELTAMLTYSGGHYVYVPSFDFYSSGVNTLSDWYVQSWTPDNQNSDIPKHYIYYPNVNATNLIGLKEKYQKSTANVKRGDIIRLRNIAISYAVPQKFCKVLKMKSARITAQANNLWYWCAAGKDVDSETLSGNGSWSIPALPSYLLKLNVQF